MPRPVSCPMTGPPTGQGGALNSQPNRTYVPACWLSRRRHSRRIVGDLSACRRGTKLSISTNIAGRGTGPNEVDRMPGCWDRSPDQIGWYARVICASTSIEEKPGVGKSEFVRKRLGVCPGDSEIAVGVAGVGRCHSHTGDAFDVGDRRCPGLQADDERDARRLPDGSAQVLMSTFPYGPRHTRRDFPVVASRRMAFW